VILVSRSTRKVIAACCFFLSSVWGAAGALKIIFGVRITFPLFPPIGLERVAPAPALIVSLALGFLGAWLERTSRATRHITRELEPTERRDNLQPGLDASLLPDRERHTASPTASRPPAA
jgi:hypothetical protein